MKKSQEKKCKQKNQQRNNIGSVSSNNSCSINTCWDKY